MIVRSLPPYTTFSSRDHGFACATSGGAWGQRWSFELTPDGPDATIVTEIYDCSRAPAEERADMDGGTVWIESITKTKTKTLERLDAQSSGQDPAQDPAKMQ
jgi:hypothetical protein